MSFDKKTILELIIEKLNNELEVLYGAAVEAKEAATHEEAKPENKYDTRGLEASYLAGAQAKRSIELAEKIDLLKKIKIRNFRPEDPLQVSALVVVEIDAEEKKNFFLLPSSGGIKVELNNEVIWTLSPESPLGKIIFEKKLGHVSELVIKEEVKEYEIISVS